MEEEYRRLMAKILRAVPGISTEEIQEMVKDKMMSNPYLNKVGALLLVAEDLGVFDVREKAPQELIEEVSFAKIGELVPGLGNISVRGIVYAIAKPSIVKDHTKLRMKIGDKTGRADVYVWDDKVEEVEKLSLTLGDQVGIINAYTKEKIGTSEVEIHLRKTSVIKRLSRDPSSPDFRDFYMTLSEIINKGEGTYDVRAIVASNVNERSAPTRFGEAPMASVLVSDGHREMELIGWRDKARLLTDLKPGTEIYVTDVRFEGGRLILTSQSFISYAEVRENASENIYYGMERKILVRVLDIQQTPTHSYVTVTDGEKVFHVLLYASLELSEGDYAEVSIFREEPEDGRIVKLMTGAIKKIYERVVEIRPPDRTIGLETIARGVGLPLRSVIVEGTLYTKTNLLTVDTKYGPGEKILFRLKEGDFILRGVAWRSKAKEIASVPEGSRIRLKWVNVGYNPFNEPEIHVENYSIIERISDG